MNGSSNEESNVQERKVGLGTSIKGNAREVKIDEAGICPQSNAAMYPAMIPINVGYSYIDPFPQILAMTITPNVSTAINRVSA
ncbi:hypothetical protein [uncultured Methanospirillum sp.]|uniref:hypothetical protein n=1 Tax=uncultured Methanospirillum sp. TaxID=262503 RepID=UPI003747EBF2